MKIRFACAVSSSAIAADASARVANSQAWLWWQDYSRTAASMDRW
ncbi:hypothetical protein [Sphingosinicella rhizophila]|uniref:Uncharacterized protein n=1 Tax=Sphingosinicella rhizophila TaxID=3050082 RepID=A0ABU3Q1Y6_9SPHN|nr:hypothetical protein [Sphingosinicella sp. GR2756]MDT9597389.1 hypothetical protein [Sphingosinicella sp. GR2756]